METRRVNMETGEILEGPTDNEIGADEDAAIDADIRKDPSIEEIESIGSTALIRIAPGRDQAIQHYADEALRIQRYAEGLVVTDLESDKRATEDVTMMKKLRGEIEVAQKQWLAPLKGYEKTIKDAFGLILAPLEVADKLTRNKILAYRQAQAAIRAEQERVAELQRQANEAALKLAQQTEAETVELIPVAEVTAPEVIKTVRTEIGTTGMVTNWKWRWAQGLSMAQIMASLPDEYKMPNETKIGQVVRAKNKVPVTEADFNFAIEIYPEQGLRVTEK